MAFSSQPSLKEITTLASKFLKDKWLLHNPASIYLLKVNKRNFRPMCKTCSKLAIETPKQCVKLVQN